MDSQKPRSLMPLIVLMVVLWSSAVAGSLIWNLYQTDAQFKELARNEALSMFNKDQGFRLWGTRHGGVYVPATENTPPSPYLEHIEERDITTPSGKKLTLVNPAYMVRQLMEDYNDLYGTKGHITGLILLRPENEPDSWEEIALNQFIEEGVKEVSEFASIDGQPFLRFMRPMVMKKGCEKCHGHLGFREGDIRGGVSVSVPLKKFNDRQNIQNRVLYLSHSSVWLIGMLLIGFGSTKLQNSVNEILRAEKEVRELNRGLEIHVADRTEELNEQKERLHKTVENAADGIIVITANGTIDTFNSSAQRIFGYEASEVIGQNVSMLMPKNLAEKHDSFVEGYLQTGNGSVVDNSREVEAVRKNGEIFPLNLAVSKIRTKEKLLFTAICRDLTESKKTANDLMEAKSDAERANRAKSEFLSSMSHELRTPLNSIIGFAQLVGLSKDLDEKQKGNIEQISEAGNHLLVLINDILDLSRIESEVFALETEALDLRPIVEECLSFVEDTAAKHKIRIYDDITFKDIPDVSADPVRLKQVLMNLLSNAIKYNVDGGQISLKSEETPGFIKLSITDTGPGIANHQLDELFEPFNRLGKESSAIEGTGIGLSITRKLMKMMDGQIGVESTLGKGSTFWIEIPLHKAE